MSKTRKWSCSSHPKRTEFDCASCGFQQVDTLREMLTEMGEQVQMYETIINGVCEVLGMNPESCNIVELDTQVKDIKQQLEAARADNITFAKKLGLLK